jgi:hypothetical protein
MDGSSSTTRMRCVGAVADEITPTSWQRFL